MTDFHLADKTILIIGCGETGLAAARWCLRQQAQVRMADTSASPAGMVNLSQTEQEHMTFFLGLPQCYSEVALTGVDSIVLSPGVSPIHTPLKEFLAQASSAGIEVVSDVELFVRALRHLHEQADYQYRLVAITGTNGKTTVTTMVRDMCQYAGFTALAAGNISPSVLNALMQALDEQSLPQVWVLELSSFQMVATHTLAPDASVVLNITQDHLDWHGSMEHYIDSKAKLLNLSRLAIVNRGDPLTVAMIPSMEALNVASFGLDEPSLVHDMGLQEVNGMTWLCAREPDELEIPVSSGRKKKNAAPLARAEGIFKRLMPADAMRVRGRHNALNALAALQLCRALGISYAPLLTALRDYQAQPHRCVFVRSVQAVDFIDDSKGTNVGATLAALLGMDRPVVLIAGGLGKGQDFSPLIPALEKYARVLLLIGQDKQLIADAVQTSGVEMAMFDSLEQAVQASLSYAKSTDVVLLSPACASMDMFKNYHHRGLVFVQAVEQLALDMGEL